MKHKLENTYCLDSSVLITMHRFYPKKIIPDLWTFIEDLFNKRKVFSHDFVFDEIVPKSESKDELAKFISKHKVCFRPITKRQAQLVPEILSHFPNLIDPRSKTNQADPWIIAMVVEMMEEVNLFGKDSNIAIVSTENENSSTKIPAVCKHYKVRHLNLFEFFEDNNWQFSLSKRI